MKKFNIKKITNTTSKIIKYIKTMFACSIPFLLIIIVLLVMYNISENKNHKLEQANEVVITEYFVEEELKSIGKIETAEYTYSDEKTLSDYRNLNEFVPINCNIPFTEKKITVMYSGKTIVSYNVEEINPTIIAKTIFLKIPEPIVDDYIVKEITKNEDNNHYNTIDGEDFDKLRNEVRETGHNKAIEKGIILEAESQLKDILSGHFKEFGYQVKFQ